MRASGSFLRQAPIKLLNSDEKLEPGRGGSSSQMALIIAQYPAAPPTTCWGDPAVLSVIESLSLPSALSFIFNGKRPFATASNVKPSDHTSQENEYFSPLIRSGDIYDTVPTNEFANPLVLSSALLMPKSPILISPDVEHNIFAGLMSRWMLLFACKKHRPLMVWYAISASTFSSLHPPCWTRSSSDPPSMYSITRLIIPDLGSTNALYKLRICGLLTPPSPLPLPSPFAAARARLEALRLSEAFPWYKLSSTKRSSARFLYNTPSSRDTCWRFSWL
mmetsp:Transcript_96034/g.188597  ORF Transcript_96034/g.188597 Transcript_96034/m.188597 type:complete len:277 (+) Transcript_96034:1828-2658(+)